MSWFGSAPARWQVDTGSEQWRVCLHEMGHAVVARHLGWTRHEITVRRTWLGEFEGSYRGDWPHHLDGDELALQRAAVLLGGPEVSRRDSWLFLPSGCGWDLDQARKILRRSGVNHGQAQALARRLVARHSGEIEREARRLYLEGGVWRR